MGVSETNCTKSRVCAQQHVSLEARFRGRRRVIHRLAPVREVESSGITCVSLPEAPAMRCDSIPFPLSGPANPMWWSVFPPVAPPWAGWPNPPGWRSLAVFPRRSLGPGPGQPGLRGAGLERGPCLPRLTGKDKGSGGQATAARRRGMTRSPRTPATIAA